MNRRKYVFVVFYFGRFILVYDRYLCIILLDCRLLLGRYVLFLMNNRSRIKCRDLRIDRMLVRFILEYFIEIFRDIINLS